MMSPKDEGSVDLFAGYIAQRYEIKKEQISSNAWWSFWSWKSLFKAETHRLPIGHLLYARLEGIMSQNVICIKYRDLFNISF